MCFSGTTYIDDLEPLLQQRLGLVREVVRHAADGGRVGLVDVHALDRAAEGLDGTAVSGVLGLAADGVVEDEDAGGSGAGGCQFLRWCWKRQENSRVLEQLFSLGVVLGLDLVVVQEVLFLAGVVVELEAVAIERVVGLVASDVGDDDLEGEGGSEVCLWAALGC